MTKEEFISRRNAGKKQQRRFAIIFGLCYALFGFVGAVCALLFARGRSDPVSVVSIWLLIFLFGGIALAGWVGRRKAMKLGWLLVCPACQKYLMGVSEQVAIATGRCGLCGGSVFDEKAQPITGANAG